MDREEQGGPPPTVRNAPPSIKSSSLTRSDGSVRSSFGWCRVSMQSTQGHPRQSMLSSQRREPANSESAPGPPRRQIEEELRSEKMKASAGKVDKAGNLASSA